MRCRGAVTLPLLLVPELLVGVMAGNFVDEIRRNFQMGLFARQEINDIQQFNPSGPLGGKAAAKIEFDPSNTEKPFKITNSRLSEGQTFNDFGTASKRVCDDQKNDCADSANSGNNKDFSVQDCDNQHDQCMAVNQPFEDDGEFLYFCE
ncbi:uncharacterized protein F4812DRAFT_15924 [Daldinia caldariorum]|uniref:uncharacterized protein n=1 Tax=Daldinia caldariorum TaxID=326644 RepID=UPI00200797D9|nr:uncharacterized protein F4812DRAFT_15924 [Daldinia caldariorum]KAI1472526.1 hypothetical protein F4812DRAFT_15924 [Daldinia caldariorum]